MPVLCKQHRGISRLRRLSCKQQNCQCHNNDHCTATCSQIPFLLLRKALIGCIICCLFLLPPMQSSSSAPFLQGSPHQQLQREQHGSHIPISSTTQQYNPTLLSDLPPELLVEVLSRVQLPLRLGSCSQVRSTWRAATPAGTSAVNVRLDGYSSDSECAEDIWENDDAADEAAGEVLASRDSVPCLQQWLAAHGAAAVTQLSVKADTLQDTVDRPVLQLP
jgi:hypothetical protein